MSVGKSLRILVLLTILMLVAVTQCQKRIRLADWSEPLRIGVYPILREDSADGRRYAERLDESDFVEVGLFLQREARRYGLELSRPFDFYMAPVSSELPPQLSGRPGMLGVAWWSLKARYWAWRQTLDDDIPNPDVRLFLVLETPRPGLRLQDSVGVRNAAYAIVRGFAARRFESRNRVVVAHELLHVLGATDKYDPETGLIFVPEGLAEPNRRPLYPQRYAEIMAGRIAVSPGDRRMPSGLAQTVIGPVTAVEIGWPVSTASR